MKKRVIAGLLWFYVTWYAWGVIAYFAGVTDLPGPLLEIVAAALFAGDSFGRVWGGKPLRGPVLGRPNIGSRTRLTSRPAENRPPSGDGGPVFASPRTRARLSDELDRELGVSVVGGVVPPPTSYSAATTG